MPAINSNFVGLRSSSSTPLVMIPISRIRIRRQTIPPDSSNSIIFSCLIVALFAAASSHVLPIVVSAATPHGFVSIDCGRSASAGNYVDASEIEWVPDGAIWPELDDGWSATANVTPPAVDMGADAKKYETLRYFPAAGGKQMMNQSKLCYAVPAVGGNYYLVRATFWMGAQALYSTRASGVVSFVLMVDTYVGTRVTVDLPQSEPLIEELYVRALDGASSIAVCLSAANDGYGNDAPFVNSIELRPLALNMTSVMQVTKFNTALRLLVRYDLGASASAPRMLRYPNDTFDRTWRTRTSEFRNETTNAVAYPAKGGLNDRPPIVALQTTEVAPTNAGLTVNVTLPAGTAFSYYLAMFFAELDPRVNASGQRVFNVSINGYMKASMDVDVFAQVGALAGYELYTGRQFGPYSDNIVVDLTANDTILFPPILSAIEILQYLTDSIANPTNPSDVLAIQNLTKSFSSKLSSFSGDPCMPSDYRNTWINCSNDITPRVTAISLSNFNSDPGKVIPASINDLDRVTQILLDGNELEGPLPDLSNLLNLRVLDLSSNKLNGSIPESLASLPKLTYIGVIPIALLQKEGLTLRYDGNSFLCITNNATCGDSTSSTETSKNLTLLIVGIVVGLAIFIIISLFIVFRYIYKHKGQKQQINETSTTKYHPQVVRHTQVIKAANVARAFTFQDIVMATQNFSTELGRGGFGPVYKGTLENGLQVAIKVLSDASQQGIGEFLNEVSLLSRARHKNLVSLLGYCIDTKVVLIYEYMPKGSLFDAIFGNERSVPLKWMERLQILLDAAQGLAYLHHGCSSPVIHRDVKSSNILLTKDLGGKICDFGISRLKVTDDDAITTKLVGSLGYMDPEYASTCMLSEKVDVYGFGIVILETLCGQHPLMKDPRNEIGEIHIAEWVRPLYERFAIEDIVDHSLDEYNSESIWKVLEVAMACIQFDGDKRPTMKEICNELLEALRLESHSQNAITK